jgi:NifB/MoaA-like Fe-S oxidoreductase
MIKTGDLPPLRHYTRAEAETIIDLVEGYQREFAAADPDENPFVYLSDEWYYLTERDFPPARHYGLYSQVENGVGMTRFLLDQWSHTRRRLPVRMSEPRRITLVTGRMALPVINRLAEDLRAVEQLNVQLLPVVNTFFGEQVTVAGLLCGQDVLDALYAQDERADLILLPRVMLDNEGVRFLDDMTVEEFKAKLAPARVEFVRNAQETIDAVRTLAGIAKVDGRKLVRVQSRL